MYWRSCRVGLYLCGILHVCVRELLTIGTSTIHTRRCWDVLNSALFAECTSKCSSFVMICNSLKIITWSTIADLENLTESNELPIHLVVSSNALEVETVPVSIQMELVELKHDDVMIKKRMAGIWRKFGGRQWLIHMTTWDGLYCACAIRQHLRWSSSFSHVNIFLLFEPVHYFMCPYLLSFKSS